jgi:hypothetical protein
MSAADELHEAWPFVFIVRISFAKAVYGEESSPIPMGGMSPRVECVRRPVKRGCNGADSMSRTWTCVVKRAALPLN